MKGLVRNNFYSLASNLQLSAFIAFVLLVASVLVGEESLIPMLLAMQSYVFIVNSGAPLHIDSTSKWSTFELTMPIKRSDVVKARYVSFLMLSTCGLGFSMLTSVLVGCVLQFVSIVAIVSGITMGISLSLMTSALMYPIMLKIGTEKNEMIISICAGIAMCVYIAVAMALSPFTDPTVALLVKPLVGIVSVGVAFVIFGASYFVSCAMYQKKEFA